MTEPTPPATPAHLWIVGLFGVLLNGFAAYDYTMTETRNAAYLAQFSAEQVAWFMSFPPLMVAAWAVGVWGALLASLLLLLRSRRAFPVFLVAMAGLIVTTVWQLLDPPPGGTFTTTGLTIVCAIWLSEAALTRYAQAMTRRGVLR
jgi:hypothetical protein